VGIALRIAATIEMNAYYCLPLRLGSSNEIPIEAMIEGKKILIIMQKKKG